MRDLKSFTSRSLKVAIKENNQESRKEWMMERAGKKTGKKSIPFQQEDSHPIELYDKEVFLQKLNYIHNNPVEAGFVESLEDIYIAVLAIVQIKSCDGDKLCWLKSWQVLKEAIGARTDVRARGAIYFKFFKS